MPLEKRLLRGERIIFVSSNDVYFNGQKYRVVMTNRRIILYAQRGAIFKRDDIVAIPLEEVKAIEYKEKGILSRTGIIEIRGKYIKTLLAFQGPAERMRALYQQMISILP